MKRIKLIGGCILLGLMLSACQAKVDTKAAYLQRYASYIAAIKSDYATCDNRKSAGYDLEFVKLSEAQYLEYKQALTEAEQRQVDTWYWEYHQAVVHRKVLHIAQQLKEGYHQADLTIKKYINP